jgi:hypothetical protein
VGPDGGVLLPEPVEGGVVPLPDPVEGGVVVLPPDPDGEVGVPALGVEVLPVPVEPVSVPLPVPVCEEGVSLPPPPPPHAAKARQKDSAVSFWKFCWDIAHAYVKLSLPDAVGLIERSVTNGM